MKIFSNYKLILIFTIIACILSPHNYVGIDGSIDWIQIARTVVFGVCVFLVGNLFCYMLQDTELEDTRYRKKSSKIFVCLAFYLIPLLIIGWEWLECFPAKLSTDSYVQLQQIELNQYSDIHPATHTLFCKLLMQINNSPATVIFFQILFMSLISGFGFYYLYKKGVKSTILWPILLIWSCLGPVRSVTCYFWKDVFFAEGLLLLTIIVIKILDDKENTSIVDLILGGIALSAITLFRHNGIFIYGASVIMFIYFTKKFKAVRMIAPIIVALLIIIPVKTLVYDHFAVRPNTDGTKYAFPAKAIVSVVYNDGRYTAKELEEIEKLMPKKMIETYYDDEIGQGLLWSTTSMKGVPRFGNTLEGKELEILELFIRLFPKNSMIMLKDMWGSASLMLSFQFDNKSQYANPKLMETDIANNFGYGTFLEHNMLYLFMLLICMAMIKKNKKEDGLWPFLPIIANVISIVISNISYEARYAYPTICCTAILIAYTMYKLNTKENETEIITETTTETTTDNPSK